jgi:curved DNA-binding protein CbpA
MAKPATCYYKLLNVSVKAESKEIKTSYYKLAKKHHPDAQHNKEGKSED